MELLSFSATPDDIQHQVCILIKEASFNRPNIKEYYVQPLEELGVDTSVFMAASLVYGRNNKVTAQQVADNLEVLSEYLEVVGCEYIVCADSAHFKRLTGQKPDECLDVISKCTYKGFEKYKAIYSLNYNSLLYNPDQQHKIDIANETLASALKGSELGRIQVKFDTEILTEDFKVIEDYLTNLLHKYDELTLDIEGFGLKLGESKIGTIGFAWSDKDGISFPIDYAPMEQSEGRYGYFKQNNRIRKLLKQFLEDYKGKLVAHNVAFDFKHLIWELFMEHPLDYKGMIHGIETLCRNYDDTKLMAYCAYNSTSRPSKRLKDLVYEFAGSYAESDIKDITLIEMYRLLRYNLTDCVSTYWLKHTKLMPIIIQDEQEGVYQHLLRVQRITLQAELVGMPMNDEKINQLDSDLQFEVDTYLSIIMNSEDVKETEYVLRCAEAEKYNNTRKTKRKSPDDFESLKFNVNSNNQLRVLLYDVMQLPVLRKTKSGLPATGAKVIKLLTKLNLTDEEQNLLKAICDYAEVNKVLNDFVPNFKGGILKADGRRYVHGSTNIGGTASGRNSSSLPNLQNMPAHGRLGKAVKDCFQAPKGYLFTYNDFQALEDKVSALLSRDPNKMRIYTDGIDGHSLRAYRYFGKQMPDIDPSTPEGINAIETKYPELRSKGKAPTFLMTYLGTAIGLEMNCGFSKEEAKMLYEAYHKEYAVTDAYNQSRLELAARQGYLTLAFGLRLRCPLLRRTPREGDRNSYRTLAAEKRTVNNADGQSYGMLNDRAVVEHMERVWNSPYRYDILYINPIHDASYYIIKDDIDVIKFHNDSLAKAMLWQDDPRIAHDKVKLGGEMDLCYESWANPITIPNFVDKETIFKLWDEGVAKIEKKRKEALEATVDTIDEEEELRELYKDEEDEE